MNLTAAEKKQLEKLIVETVTQTKPKNATHWSTRTLAVHLNETLDQHACSSRFRLDGAPAPAGDGQGHLTA